MQIIFFNLGTLSLNHLLLCLISRFRRIEISKQTNANADDSNFRVYSRFEFLDPHSTLTTQIDYQIEKKIRTDTVEFGRRKLILNLWYAKAYNRVFFFHKEDITISEFYSFIRSQLVFDWFSALRNSSQDLGVYFKKSARMLLYREPASNAWMRLYYSSFCMEIKTTHRKTKF